MPSKKRPDTDTNLTSGTPATPASKKTRSKAPSTPKPSAPAAPDAAVAKKPTAARTTKPPAVRKKASPKPVDAVAAPLHILMVTPEAHPFAKTGGLAEVTGALPLALARLGHRVTLVVPRYRGVTAGKIDQTILSVGGHAQPVGFAKHAIEKGLDAVLVDVPELFDREGLYGTADGDYADNAWRFAVFSRAALEYPRLVGERPSIIHAHDWQTGLLSAYQKMHLSADPIVGGVPAIFTIHNLAFQGVFPPATLDEIGLGWEVFNLQAMEYWGQISYLKAGINFSEKITTVSPNYAREIVTPEMGFGLEGVLSRRAADLVGILNGIDTERWNPSADQYVAARFSADDLSGKRKAKELLLEIAGLPRDEAAMARPVIGLVTRLTDQKGMDLIAAAADELMALDASWTMIGNGEPRYEELWTWLAARYPDRVAARIGFDERVAHHIEAGADAFLMPSRFEPCGLNQLYSLRYGTVPIVRATGGLEDTVENYDPATRRGTGIKFRDFTPSALVAAVARAVELYRDPDTWRRIQQAGMQQDHSWDVSAREYVKVYRAVGALTPDRR
jgi:starch synthase